MILMVQMTRSGTDQVVLPRPVQELLGPQPVMLAGQSPTVLA
jgi:hypothetical protein